MQEFYNLIMIFTIVPLLIGGFFAFCSRKPKYYYKHAGNRWIRKR